MNFRQRIKTSWDILRGRETKQGAGERFPLIWPSYRKGYPQWQIIDLASYISEGFNLNTLIYSAIMFKVRALRAAPLRAYTGDPDQPERLPADDPLSKLVARPNPRQSWMALHGQNTVYLNIAGNVYIWMIRPKAGGQVEQMYSLRPDRVYIIPNPDKKTIIGFLYVPEGAAAWGQWDTTQRREAMAEGRAVPILPQDMAHIKLPNPGDPLDGLGYGLSPLAPLAQSADVDNNVTKFLKIFFEKGAVITGLLSFDVPMQPGDVATARERWKEIYGGVDNWDVAVLDQGGKYQKVGMSFDEMGFETIDDRNESRILGPLGVPGILIGTRLGLNRAINANAKELRMMCWQDTLVPENALFEDELQYFLQGDGGQFVAFDYGKVEALKKDTVQLVDAAYKLWGMGSPANLAVRTVGLQMEDIPGGDVGYLPLAVVPVSSDAGKPQLSQVGTPEAEQQAGKALAVPDATHKSIYVPSADEQKALELAAMRREFGAALSDFKAAIYAQPVQPSQMILKLDGVLQPPNVSVTAPTINLPAPQTAITLPVNVQAAPVQTMQQNLIQVNPTPVTVVNENNIQVPAAPAPVLLPLDVNLSVAPTTSVVRRNSFGQIEQIESVPNAEVVNG